MQFREVLTACDVLDFLRTKDVKTRKKALRFLCCPWFFTVYTQQNHGCRAVGLGPGKTL